MKKKLYSFVLFFGFLSLVYVIWKWQIPTARVAWFFWSSSLLFLPISAFFILAEYFLNYWPSVKNSPEFPQSSRSFFGSPFKFVSVTLLSHFISGIFHMVIGLFLSIVLPVEPFQLFNLEGYNNHFSLGLAWYHVQNFSILVPFFLLMKGSLIFLEQGLRLRGHASVRDGFVPLMAGFVSVLVFKNESSLASSIFFGAILFLPWTALFGKDRFDKVATRESEFQIPIKIPVEYTYRAHISWFWGILLLCISIMILGLCFFSSIKIIQAEQGSIIAALLVGIMGIFFSTGIVFVGMNLFFAFRKVLLTREQVEFFEKSYVVFIPKEKSWKSSMAEYIGVEGHKKMLRGGTDSNAYYFVVQLIHANDSKKNIELYRAYHSDEYLKIAEQWKKLLVIGCK